MAKFQYQLKEPEVIEAVKFDSKASVEETDVYPTWLIAAVADKLIVVDESNPHGVGVWTARGFVECDDGDWIIRDSSGDIEISTDEEFNKFYESVDK